MGAMRALLVEDEPRLRATLARGLREEGWAVDEAGTCATAGELWHGSPYDFVVLDLGLPDGDGLTLLRDARRRGIPTPVLLLTARDRVADRVKGLDAGADDYLVKPFSYEELLARCRALSRRGPASTPPILTAGDLALDLAGSAATVAGRDVGLTAKEFALLRVLVQAKGRVVSKGDLLERCWEASFGGVSNVVEVHVASLRRKLKDRGSSVAIRALRNLGYRFETPR